jgi:phospholipid/cholesterol/gamma-HCH transport system ATP-binding protein
VGAAIAIEGIRKRFGGQQVLDGVDLAVASGETVVIIGRSGCGKSVLLKHVIGLLAPDAGRVCIDGENLAALSRRELFSVRRRFGFVFQGAALFDSMTVAENVGLALLYHSGLDERAIGALVAEKLALVGLEGLEGKRPAELSGGMRKRVGVARALAMDPAVVLYDEPTTGLDPIMSDVINELILTLQRKLGITSIVVTHDMTSAYKVGDRIAMLYGGRIIFSGTPEEVRRTPDPFVRQFVEGRAEGPIAL